MLRLGLQDTIVGTLATAPGTFPEDIAAQVEELPKLGGEYIPGNYLPIQREQMLEADPDLVIGAWPSNFDPAGGALSQDELAERGVESYFETAALCPRTGPVEDLSLAYEELRTYGTVFDVQQEAEALIAEMESQVAKVQEAVGDLERPDVLSYSWEDGGGGDAYANGNQFFGNGIITLAGGRNIFEDIDTVYGDVGWEEVIERDPDIIVIEIFGKATQEEFDEVFDTARNFFLSDPAFASMTAVQQDRFTAVPAQGYYVAGYRNAESVRMLAEAFHPDAFTG